MHSDSIVVLYVSAKKLINNDAFQDFTTRVSCRQGWINQLGTLWGKNIRYLLPSPPSRSPKINQKITPLQVCLFHL